MEITGRITKKLDGSYLIDSIHGPRSYHAHQEATPDAYKSADEYAKANPGMVDLEQAPDPAEVARLAEIAGIEGRIAELQAYLDQTDKYAIREYETGKAQPEGMKEDRQTARDEISTLREQLEGK